VSEISKGLLSIVIAVACTELKLYLSSCIIAISSTFVSSFFALQLSIETNVFGESDE